jgi:hypothetical protein
LRSSLTLSDDDLAFLSELSPSASVVEDRDADHDERQLRGCNRMLPPLQA